MLLRGARPFKAKLYLICSNNKCFDFKPMLYISLGTPERGEKKRKTPSARLTWSSSGSRRARTKEWSREQDAAHRACQKLSLHSSLKLKCARRFGQTPHVRRLGRRSFDNSSSRRARTKEWLRAQDAAHRARKKLCLRPALKLKCAFFQCPTSKPLLGGGCTSP